MTGKVLFSLKLISYFLWLSACVSIIGMQDPNRLTENEIEACADKYNIPVEDNYELDSSFFSFLFSHDTSRFKIPIKNHYQPLQALYYDKSGSLVSFQVNCYAGGFPNLNWDRDSIMATFPPKLQAPNDSLISLDEQLLYLKPLSHTKKFVQNTYDNIVIVYWNKFMGKQSKRLIQFIQDNCKLASNKNVKIIYANNDNLFAKAVN